MKKSMLMGLLVMMAGPTFAQNVNLWELLTGRFEVQNRDCLGSGNGRGSIAVIQVYSPNLVFRIDEPYPLTISMQEGRREFVDSQGNRVLRLGIAFGNGFSYSETVRHGRFYVSQVEYQFLWENGVLHLVRRERVDSRHRNVSYCDLVPNPFK